MSHGTLEPCDQARWAPDTGDDKKEQTIIASELNELQS